MCCRYVVATETWSDPAGKFKSDGGSFFDRLLAVYCCPGIFAPRKDRTASFGTSELDEF